MPELEETADLRSEVAALHAKLDRLLVQQDGEGDPRRQELRPIFGMITTMARVGAVLRRGEEYGVVIAVGNSDSTNQGGVGRWNHPVGRGLRG